VATVSISGLGMTPSYRLIKRIAPVTKS